MQVLIQQTNRPVSPLMHTEAEISWAPVNTKNAIEESSSIAWRSWRQYKLMASPDIITLVHCGNKLLSPVTSYQGNFVHTCESCNDDSRMFVPKHILSEAIITLIYSATSWKGSSCTSLALVCVYCVPSVRFICGWMPNYRNILPDWTYAKYFINITYRMQMNTHMW